jgi:AraC-like DNA-binding protein
MSGDTLSEVLRAVRLQGAVFFSIHASDPWVVETPRSSVLAPHVMPSAQHVIPYHLISAGRGYVCIVDEQAVPVEEGDLVVFPHGDPHVLSSAPHMRGDAQQGVRAIGQAGELPILIDMSPGREGGVQLVCGYLGCDTTPFNPLLDQLPRMIHLRAADGDGALRELNQLALRESMAKTPGSEVVLERLSELMFVNVVRRHLATLAPDKTGWLAGLRDEAVGRCLAKLHAQPARAWTLEELAREVGSSRSILAERFMHFVGVPPMHYLAQWRMQLAAALLSNSSKGLAVIAAEVGYGSEAAFSRAFKRELGKAPATFRKNERR